MNLDPLAFTFEWLAGAAEKAAQATNLSVCDQGHLLVSGRTCWAPRAVTADLRSLICDPIPQHVTPTDE